MVIGTPTALGLMIIVGGLLLLFGRRLFWLFTAASGFAIGMALATRVLGEGSESLILTIAAGLGLLGAVLAVLFRRIAVSVAGFLAGAFIAAYGAHTLGVGQSTGFWVALVIGGVLGAVLTTKLFELALTILSVIAGASMIVQAIKPPADSQMIVWIVLLVFGLAIQSGLLRGKKK